MSVVQQQQQQQHNGSSRVAAVGPPPLSPTPPTATPTPTPPSPFSSSASAKHHLLGSFRIFFIFLRYTNRQTGTFKVMGSRSGPVFPLWMRNKKLQISWHEATILMPFRQCCESFTFWYGSGSADPDAQMFVIDLQEANKKLFFAKFFYSLPYRTF
jgi:hypothetical protein